jgi:ABC-2 type transport system ATP-binding protein
MAQVAGSLVGVSKRFSRRGPWVLKDIELELRPGSSTIIVGGNGSGKSTLLRIGAGVSRPTDGIVTVPDRVGYVPERLAGRTRFTAREYLAHMGRIKGLPTGVNETRCAELLERLDVQPIHDAPIASLSKGNRQKVVLAQAFLSPVSLLVLDEPFTGLDPVAHAALGELIGEAGSRGTAVIMSRHEVVPEEAGQQQLRIGGGRLAEIRDEEVPRASAGWVMEVELLPSMHATDHECIVVLPGVAAARLDRQRGLLMVTTDNLHIDPVLTAAIAQGWSVRSVSPRRRAEGSG